MHSKNSLGFTRVISLDKFEKRKKFAERLAKEKAKPKKGRPKKKKEVTEEVSETE